LTIDFKDAPKLFARYLLKQEFVEFPSRNDVLSSAGDRTKPEIPQWVPNWAAAHVFALMKDFWKAGPILLTRDMSSLATIEVDVILNCDNLPSDALFAMVKSLSPWLVPLDGAAKTHKVSINLNFYLFFTSIDADGYLNRINSLVPRTKPNLFEKTVRLSFVLVSTKDRHFRPLFPSLLDTSIALSLRSTMLQIRQNAPSRTNESGEEESGLSSLFNVFFWGPTEEVRKFCLITLELFWRPIQFANRVKLGRVTVGQALYYLALLAIGLTAIRKLLGLHETIVGTRGEVKLAESTAPVMGALPFGEGLLPYLFLLLVMTVFAAAFWPAARLLGGKSNFSKTFTVSVLTAFVGTTFIFFGDLIQSLYKSPLPWIRSIGLIAIGYNVSMLSVVQQITKARVLLASVLAALFIIIGGFVVLLPIGLIVVAFEVVTKHH